MPTTKQVAASVRRNKDSYPDNYCPQCLWNVNRSGPCPRHQQEARQQFVLSGAHLIDGGDHPPS